MGAQHSEVRDAIRTAAMRILGAETVEDVQVTDALNFFGEEILRARIILARNRAKFDGEALFELRGSVSRSAKQLGEERHVSLEYADIDELEALGDHQS